MAKKESATGGAMPHRGVTIAEKMFLAARPIRNEWSGDMGTCFAVDIGEGGRRHPFLVSNGHIVNREDCSVWFCREDKLSIRYVIPNSCWVPHEKEDLAITPLEPILGILREKDVGILLPTIPLREITSNKELGEMFDAYEEVLFIGYPQGTHQNGHVPIMRRGIAATPIYIDFAGKPRFLIDAPVFPGSSGSPIFILDSSSFSNGTGRGKFWSWPYLAGIVSGYYQATPRTGEPEGLYRGSVHLGSAIKSREILETARAFLHGERGSKLSGIKRNKCGGLLLGGAPKNLRNPPRLPAGKRELDKRYLARVSKRRVLRRGTGRLETVGPVRFRQ